MIKKFLKNFITLFVLLTIVYTCFNNVYAKTSTTDTTAADVEFFNTDHGTPGDALNATKNIMGTIITVIRTVGTGIAIIMLSYVAIKYMSAAPNEKAEFKKSAVAYIVGAIVLFATTNILGVINNFATKNL